MIDQNVPHQLRGYSKKVSAVWPLRRSLANQAQIRFVDQGGALQGVVGTFAAQMASCLAAQLIVNHGDEGFPCFLITLAPIGEQLIDPRGGIGAHVYSPAQKQASDVDRESSSPDKQSQLAMQWDAKRPRRDGPRLKESLILLSQF